MNYKKPSFWIVIGFIIAISIVAIYFLTNQKQDRFDIGIVVPASNQGSFVYSDEQISPTKKQIIITSGTKLADTGVILKPIEVEQENSYEASYLTPGVAVKMDVEKGAWYQLGIDMQNPTNEDLVVYINVKNIEVRISSNALGDLEQYRTEYIGDASKVAAIAQRLPYPEGYSYSSIELQTSTEPYELIVYLDGNDDWQKKDFDLCATTAFDLIGNMGVISFRSADTGSDICSFERNELQTN